MLDMPDDSSRSTKPVAEPSGGEQFRFTVFGNYSAQHKREFTGWGKLCHGLKQPTVYPSKSASPLLKLATFGDTRTQAGSLRSEANLLQVCGVEGDHDAGTMSIADAVLLLDIWGIECVLYTTASHTPEAPRWRVLAPLSRPIGAHERAHYVAKLNAILEGALAPESFTPCQAYHYGKVEGSEYSFKHVPGQFLDLVLGGVGERYPQARVAGQPVASDTSRTAPPRALTRSSDGIYSDLDEHERTIALDRFDEGTLAELEAALQAIDADDRDVWISVGQALASLKRTPWEQSARNLWLAWSATSPKHNPSKDHAVWDTLAGERSDYRAVFARAQREGWRPRPMGRDSRLLQATRRQMAPSASLRQVSQSAHGYSVILTQASRLTPQPIRWLWPDWLARGKLHLVAGMPGKGKTTLALEMAAIVTRGGQWPDGTSTASASVIMWSGEDDPTDTLLPRLHAMNVDTTKFYFVSGTRDGTEPRPFDPAVDMPLLREKALEIGDVAMFILDPIVSTVTGDSHNNAEVRRALQPVVDMATELNAAVLGITHVGKGSKGVTPTARVLGSIAFAAVARVILMVADSSDKDASPGARMIVRAKSNIGRDEDGFEFHVIQTALDDWPDLTASQIRWGKQLIGPAEELMAKSEATFDLAEKEATDNASLDLSELLSGGPMPSAGVKEKMLAMGYKERQIHAARKALHVAAIRQGQEGKTITVWSLPAPPGQAATPH